MKTETLEELIDMEGDMSQDTIVISQEPSVEQICIELQRVFASDEAFGALLLEAISEGEILPEEIKDKDAQRALLAVSENPGILH